MNPDFKHRDKPFVSVIVPVKNDAERIKLCLGALLEQTYPRDRYEIIVIDNGSTDATLSVIRQYPVIVLVEDTIPSSYAARNTGLASTQGQVIAFTDSDCIPFPDWLEKGVAHLQRSSNCGLLAGSVEVFFRDSTRLSAVEIYESVTAFPQRKFVEKYKFGATANVFTYRNVFDKVGLFNTSLQSGGDREWGQRVHEAGYAVVYADDVVVKHPARHSFNELYMKLVRVSKGLHHLEGQKSNSWLRFTKRLIKDIIPPGKDILEAWNDTRLRGIKQKSAFIAVLLYLRYMQAWIRLRLQLSKSRYTSGRSAHSFIRS
jgi:glycosyltransferase involved in cell wall biosynthesis